MTVVIYFEQTVNFILNAYAPHHYSVAEILLGDKNKVRVITLPGWLLKDGLTSCY